MKKARKVAGWVGAVLIPGVLVVGVPALAIWWWRKRKKEGR